MWVPYLLAAFSIFRYVYIRTHVSVRLFSTFSHQTSCNQAPGGTPSTFPLFLYFILLSLLYLFLIPLPMPSGTNETHPWLQIGKGFAEWSFGIQILISLPLCWTEWTEKQDPTNLFLCVFLSQPMNALIVLPYTSFCLFSCVYVIFYCLISFLIQFFNSFCVTSTFWAPYLKAPIFVHLFSVIITFYVENGHWIVQHLQWCKWETQSAFFLCWISRQYFYFCGLLPTALKAFSLPSTIGKAATEMADYMRHKWEGSEDILLFLERIMQLDH